MSGTLQLSGMAAGLASGGQKTIGPITMTGVATIGQISDASLAVGDNTFTVPPGPATAVAIFLGLAPAATVKLRTNLNSADAGLQVAPYSGVGFQVFTLPVGSTSVILNSSAVVPGVELQFV